MAFAISTAVSADIILMDEWLTVGDADLAAKSQRRLNELMGSAKIVVLASHDTSVLAQYWALALFGIAIPFVKLMLFLPLVFLAAALPISVAHLGTSQAAWLLFFSGSASNAKILAYSLAAHFTFMFCNGLIGLFYLPRASRELTALDETTSGHK